MDRRAWLMAPIAAAVIAVTGCASTSQQPKNIVDTAASNPSFTTLTKLINDAGLAETLRGAGPFTVFAPTNEAFAKVPAKTMAELAANKDRLKAVLTYHVVPGAVMAADVKPGSVKTVQGASRPAVALGYVRRRRSGAGDAGRHQGDQWRDPRHRRRVDPAGTTQVDRKLRTRRFAACPTQVGGGGDPSSFVPASPGLTTGSVGKPSMFGIDACHCAKRQARCFWPSRQRADRPPLPVR
jgi:hypothetical protein